jgi:hypothetical protein
MSCQPDNHVGRLALLALEAQRDVYFQKLPPHLQAAVLQVVLEDAYRTPGACLRIEEAPKRRWWRKAK